MIKWCLLSDTGELCSVVTVIHDAFCFMFFPSVHDLKENWRLELFLLQLDERLENHRAGVHRLPGVFRERLRRGWQLRSLGYSGHLVERMLKLWFFNSLPPVAGTGKACAPLSWKWPQFITSGYLYGWGFVWPRCYWLRARMFRPVSNLPHALLTWQSRWRDTLYVSKNSFSHVIFIMAFEYDIQLIFHASVDSVYV